MKLILALQKEKSYFTCYPTVHYFITFALISNHEMIVNKSERVKAKDLITRLRQIFEKDIMDKINQPTYLEYKIDRNHNDFLPTKKMLTHTFDRDCYEEMEDRSNKPEHFKQFMNHFFDHLNDTMFVEPHKTYHVVNHPRI